MNRSNDASQRLSIRVGTDDNDMEMTEAITNLSKNTGSSYSAGDQDPSPEGSLSPRMIPTSQQDMLKKNLANKIFGYLARCEFWLKLGW